MTMTTLAAAQHDDVHTLASSSSSSAVTLSAHDDTASTTTTKTTLSTQPPCAVATVTTTGVRGEELQRLCTALTAHNLHWQRELTTQTRVLIVRHGSAHSRKCVAAAVHGGGVVCVTPRWVTHGGCALSNVAAYTLHSALADRDVCTTGLSTSERAAVADVCARRGARLCATLTRHCALLVTSSSSLSPRPQQPPTQLQHAARACGSAKLHFAQQHHVPTLAWTAFVQRYDADRTCTSRTRSARLCGSTHDTRTCAAATTTTTRVWPVLTLSGVPASVKSTLAAALRRVGLSGHVQDTLVLGMRDDTDDCGRRDTTPCRLAATAVLRNTTHLVVPRLRAATSRKVHALLLHQQQQHYHSHSSNSSSSSSSSRCSGKRTAHGTCELVDVAWLLHAVQQRVWPDSAPFRLAPSCLVTHTRRRNGDDGDNDDDAAAPCAMSLASTVASRNDADDCHDADATTPRRRCSSLEMLLSDLEGTRHDALDTASHDGGRSSCNNDSSNNNNNGSDGGDSNSSSSTSVLVHSIDDATRGIAMRTRTRRATASAPHAPWRSTMPWPTPPLVHALHDTHARDHGGRCVVTSTTAAAAATAAARTDDDVAESQTVYYARPHATATLTQTQSATDDACDKRSNDDKSTKEARAVVAAHNDDSSGHAAAAANAATPRRVALLLANDVRRDVDTAALSQRLPGCVVVVDDVDACTHLVTARPSKTELFLCCVAAGKWVVAPSFVHALLQCGDVVDAAAHEWCPHRARALAQRASVVALVHACPRQRTRAQRPFAHWRHGVVLCCTSPSRAASFARVLRCGGCADVYAAASADEVLARVVTTHAREGDDGGHRDGGSGGGGGAVVLADVGTWTAKQLQQYTTMTRGRRVRRVDYMVHILCNDTNGHDGSVIDDDADATYALTATSTMQQQQQQQRRKRTRSAAASPSHPLSG